MEFGKTLDIGAPLYYIVIELVPASNSGKKRSRYVSKGMKELPVDKESQDVKNICGDGMDSQPCKGRLACRLWMYNHDSQAEGFTETLKQYVTVLEDSH